MNGWESVLPHPDHSSRRSGVLAPDQQSNPKNRHRRTDTDSAQPTDRVATETRCPFVVGYSRIGLVLYRIVSIRVVDDNTWSGTTYVGVAP